MHENRQTVKIPQAVTLQVKCKNTLLQAWQKLELIQIGAYDISF